MKYFLFLIFLTITLSSNAQTVEGFITSDNGEAIEGVNISIVNKNKGTISDSKGFYSVKISANLPTMSTNSILTDFVNF